MAQDLQSDLQQLQNEYDLLKALEEFRSQQLKDANSTVSKPGISKPVQTMVLGQTPSTALRGLPPSTLLEG